MYNLKKYNQEQVLRFYDSLNKDERDSLDKQLESIDLELVNEIYKKSYTDEKIDISKISCLNIIKKNNISEDKILGETLVKNNQYAIVIMAGGFGSRLGLNKPKGCLELQLREKKISLFELFINELKEANKKYDSNIPLYIMTSTSNNKETIDYFEQNNYFAYKDNIKLFTQENFPILDVNGKLVLKNKHEILMGPNGNGDVFASLKRNNIINDMKKNNIKYVLFSTIDNVLSNLVDVQFIGTCLKNKYGLASKTIMKKNEEAKDWVFCKYNNRPYMLQSHYIDKEITNAKDKNEEYIYREKNITYHLVSMENVELFANKELRYHRAHKNNKYLNEKGNLIKTKKKNSFKFEKFIFDAFYYADDMLLYRIDEKEFCPIKEKVDIDKAINILNNKYNGS